MVPLSKMLACARVVPVARCRSSIAFVSIVVIKTAVSGVVAVATCGRFVSSIAARVGCFIPRLVIAVGQNNVASFGSREFHWFTAVCCWLHF